MSKEIKGVIEYIERHGFELVRQKKHFIFKMGDKTMTVSKTPNQGHALDYVKRDLRRFGITPLPL